MKKVLSSLSFLMILILLLISGCISPPVCGNGVCETDETPVNCNINNGGDCPSQDLCGNGICDVNNNETNQNCASDCNVLDKAIFYAPEIKPDNFLGDFVFKEAPSDWKNYAPLREKVLEITANTQDDLEKAEKIAVWVQKSKDYGGDSIANRGGTIIDIFDANTGICLDSAILTVAMLRIANVPAAAVQPVALNAPMHEITFFYANNGWWQIDSTFCKGCDNPEALSYNQTAGTWTDITFTSTFYCSDKYSQDESSRQFTRYFDFPMTLNKYGKTCIPFLKEYGINWENGYSSPAKNYYDFMFSVGPTIGESHYNLYYLWGTNYKRPAKTCDSLFTTTLSSNYLYCLDMPIGKYKLLYFATNENTIANLEFEIRENQRTEITESNFKSIQEDGNQDFNDFISKIKRVLDQNITK